MSCYLNLIHLFRIFPQIRGFGRTTFSNICSTKKVCSFLHKSNVSIIYYNPIFVVVYTLVSPESNTLSLCLCLLIKILPSPSIAHASHAFSLSVSLDACVIMEVYYFPKYKALQAIFQQFQVHQLGKYRDTCRI